MTKIWMIDYINPAGDRTMTTLSQQKLDAVRSLAERREGEMGKLIGDAAIHPETLAKLRELGERGQKWGAFQNHDLASAGLRHLRFLKYGPDCTFKEAPSRYPDTPGVIGWRYVYVGDVNLETGEVQS